MVPGPQLLARGSGVLGAGQPHEGDDGVTPAQPRPDVRGDALVGQHQPGRRPLAHVAEPVQRVTAQLVRAEHEQRVPPGHPGPRPVAGVTVPGVTVQQVGQRDRQVGAEHPAARRAHPLIQRDHAQRAARRRHEPGAGRGELAQPGLQDPGPVKGRITGRTGLADRGGYRRPQVRQGLAAEPAGQVEPGQVAGQHPDQRVGTAGPRDAEQVQRDRGAGQVEYRDLASRGQLAGGGRGEHRGPAGERAARDVRAVRVRRDADRVPAFLPFVGEPPDLPLLHLGRVLGLPGKQAALLRLPGPADPRAFVGHPQAQGALALPEGVPADRRDQRAAGHPEPGKESAESAGGAERDQHQAERDGDGERGLQRPVELALLAALSGRPVRAEPFGFRRRGTARRRPRIRVGHSVLPAQPELADTRRGHHDRGDQTLVFGPERKRRVTSPPADTPATLM